jgi:glycosyltransferase involved in cell wall biosynthesis
LTGNRRNRRRICIVVSDFMTVSAFLQDQIRALCRTYEVTIVANTDDRGSLRRLNLDAELVPVAISRDIDLRRDVLALLDLYLLFRKRKFNLVHSITPKAGLLSMTAGKLAGIPVRIHTFTGQVWAARSGATRYLLKRADKVTVFCATRVLTDSQSQLQFLIAEGVVGVGQCRVLANGSLCGVDPCRFRPNAAARLRVRDECSIPEDASVFLFVGRLKKDKGVLDLARAFAQVARQRRNAYLLWAGPDEDRMEGEIRSLCSSCAERVRFTGRTRFPEQYMAAADIICLPSYREGFGNVVIEAAAAGIPAIASRIYGLTDAVEDGATGCLHQAGNWEELAQAMESLAANDSLRLQLGLQARARASRDFAQQSLTEAWLAFYVEQLAAEAASAAALPV